MITILDCLNTLAAIAFTTYAWMTMYRANEYIKNRSKMGRWILTDAEGIGIWHCNCSECGKDPQDYIYGTENWWLIKNNLPKFCPACGAKMEAKE